MSPPPGAAFLKSQYELEVRRAVGDQASTVTSGSSHQASSSHDLGPSPRHMTFGGLLVT